MPDIAQRIARFNSELPADVTLCAVSKFHPVDALRCAYNAGQRVFGESRVQELLAKIPQLPSDIRWHFIGHLQTNKVRRLIGHTAMIESVDSERLLAMIDDESARAGITTRVLMQVHVAAEETKFGFSPDELIDYFRRRAFESLKATHICGIMGMATNTDDRERILSDFRTIRSTFDTIVGDIAPDLRGFDTVSMGMTDDYADAIACGSTLVRIGSGIFGPRQY
ncbi:MAG: YggS family pyridoxal phosphate-dependent enzyme [Bacteroides sp.]|nr:YggS family pyridoxal phosphate-dependent enzyme [Bacteroides sp.]MCM1413615.1 YggS family pyridoxal phosphate-dependent enzyme [Bacteroides sp.]MCM1471168.1 YggS family pyridoxal phosphate-dependent enzyme [Bacteroides sp.]